MLQQQTHRKRDQICDYQRWGEGRMDEDSQKVQNYRSKISTRNAMYNMINVINTDILICYIWKFRENPKNFHHKKTIFSFILNLYNVMDIP